MLNKGAMKANYFHTRMQVACNQKRLSSAVGGERGYHQTKGDISWVMYARRCTVTLRS